MTDLPVSAGGHITAFGATAVSGVVAARRAMKSKLLADAGSAALPGTYRCAVWVGAVEIALAAETIRRVRPGMESDSNPFDQLEYALSEVASISKVDDPPVLMMGVLAVTGNPLDVRT